MSDSLRDLTLALQEFARVRDWGRFHSPKNLAMALSVEAAEVLEHFQWRTGEESDALPPQAKAEVAQELADVLLYLVQLAARLDVDLLAQARAKMALNAARFPPAEGDAGLSGG